MEIWVHGHNKYDEDVSADLSSYEELESWLKDYFGYEGGEVVVDRVLKEVKAKGYSDWEGNLSYIEFERESV
jgi:hypothetical protein